MWIKIIGGVVIGIALLIMIPGIDDIFINIPLATILFPIINNWIGSSILAFAVAYGITYLIGILLFILGLILII